MTEHALYETAHSTVARFYKGKSANRSGVPYMDHITQGLKVMEAIGASADAKGAYCLHPLVQSDDDFNARLADASLLYEHLSPIQLILAMEYRHVANSFLSPITDDITLFDVNNLKKMLHDNKDLHHMLVADKVQNYKDFLLYHKGTHKHSERLDRYFKMWLNHILIVNYEELVKNITED